MVSVLLDAEIIAVGSRGRRTIPAEDFFRTVFTTALEPYELLSEVILPVLPDSARFGFVEFSRRAGDFAIVASSVVIDVGSNGIINPRVALAGVGGTPVRAVG